MNSVDFIVGMLTCSINSNDSIARAILLGVKGLLPLKLIPRCSFS